MTDLTDAEKADQQRRYHANARTHAAFLEWWNETTLDTRKYTLDPPSTATYFDRAIATYEHDRGQRMHHYYRRQCDYWLARWRGMERWVTPLSTLSEIPVLRGPDVQV